MQWRELSKVKLSYGDFIMVENLVRIDMMRYIKQMAFALVLVLMPSYMLSAADETFVAGSKIINMSPAGGQTVGVLKSYGLLYELYKKSVEVKWVIKENKTGKDDTDFSHNSIDYKSSAFVIPAGYLHNPAVSSLVDTWQHKGVTIDTADSNFTVPVYATLTYMPNTVLDSDSGSIAQSYFDNAEVSSAVYKYKSADTLGTCDDFYALPHADPSWDADKKLKDFVEHGAYVWASSHVPSGLENSVGTTDDKNLTFLSVDGAVSYGDHGNGTAQYTNDYNNTNLYAPMMQFLGNIDDATTNGSEQVYIPKTTWRATTHIGVDDGGTHAILAYGPAYGLSSNGWVMYEAGYKLDKATTPDNIAAQRAFLNFWLQSAVQRATVISANVPTTMTADNKYDINASSTDSSASYTWKASCNGGHSGVFTDPSSASATFTPGWSDTDYECIITVETIDGCSRRVFNSHPVEVKGYPKVDLSLDMTDSQDPVPTDTNFTYTLTVTNHGPSTASGFKIADTLPNAVNFVSTTEDISVCDHTGGSPDVVKCVFPDTVTIDANGTYSVGITVTSPSNIQTFTNSAEVNTSQVDVNPSNGTATEQTTTAGTTDLNISVTGPTIPLLANTDIDYVVSVVNKGDKNSTAMVVEDHLPEHMSYVSSGGNDWHCIYSSSTRIVQCEQATTIAAGAVAPELTITAKAATVGNFSSLIKARDKVLADVNISDNSAEYNITTFTASSANLAIKMTVASPAIGKDGTAKFTILLTNNGPDTATDINITDLYDTNSSGFDSSSFVQKRYETKGSDVNYTSSNPTKTNGSLVWNIDSMDPNTTVTIDYEMDRNNNDDANSYPTINRVGVSANAPFDPDESDNNDSVLIDATRYDADIAVSKLVSIDPAMEGMAYDYNITVTNKGTYNLTGLSSATKKPYFIDTLPAELTWNSTTVDSGSPWSCEHNATDNSIRCDWNSSVEENWTKGSDYNFTINVIPTRGNIDVKDKLEIGYEKSGFIDSDPLNNKKRLTTTVETAHLDINVTNEVNATQVNPGEYLTYTVKVGNEGPANASSLVIDEVIPKGTEYNASSVSNGVYDPALGLWNIGELNASHTATLTLKVLVYGTNDINNTARVSSVYQTDTDPSNSSATAMTLMNVADLFLSKTANAEQNATVGLGQTASYEINVTNLGIVTATNVVLNDLLDVRQKFISYDTHGTGDYNVSSGDWVVGDVAVGERKTLTIVAQPLKAGEYIPNEVHIHSVDQPDTNLTANTANTTLMAISSDIKVTVEVNQSKVAKNDNATYILRAENMGPSNASTVVVKDVLPASATYDSHSGGIYDSGTGEWSVNALSVGEVKELNITAKMTQLGTITNEANLTSTDQYDANSNNNGDSVIVSVGGEADLALTKIGDRAVATRGSTMTFKLKLENLGPDNASDVNISDLIPEGMTYRSHSVSNGEYNDTTGVWSQSSLANGDSAELNITVYIDLNASDSITNSASITSVVEGDPDPITNQSSATISIRDMQIQATPDSFSVIGRDGGMVGDVTANDELNSAAVNDADINITLTGENNISTTPSIDADGNLTIEANTTMGSYYIEYRICELANPSNCSEANVTLEVNASAIVANDDNGTSVNGEDGGQVISNIVTNDKLDGSSNPTIGVDVNITVVTSSSGLNISETNGSVTVPAGTSSGTYKATYKICENLNPTNCSEANITEVVTDAPIVAHDDDFTATNVKGRSGGVAGDLDANDTLNGEAVNTSDVNITITNDNNISTTPTVDVNNGNLIIPNNTPKGSYRIEYSICEKINPSNCAEANATVTVVQADLSATPDSNQTVYSKYGGVAIKNVVTNDYLDGDTNLTIGTDVNITAVTDTCSAISITRASGEVSVAAETNPGDYQEQYKICENLNPDNCGNATIYIKVLKTPIDAVDDLNDTVVGMSGGVGVLTIQANDTLGEQTGQVLGTDINITEVTSDNPSVISVDKSTGEVNVTAGTKADSYMETYKICETDYPDNCDEANLTVVVQVAPIEANDDNFTTTGVNGRTGGDTVPVIANDKLNNADVNISDVNLTLTGDTNLSTATLESNGSIKIASQTQMGTYYVEYKMCEKLNPSNCKEANATVRVKAVDIVANDDANNSVVGKYGGTAVANIVANDTLDGVLNPSIGTDVNISNITTSSPKITISSTTGKVDIASNTKVGTYTGAYKLCENLNPSNCNDANVTIQVVAARIDAVDIDLSSTPIKGSTGGGTAVVISNDTLGNGAVVASDVNISLNGDTNISTTLSIESNGSINIAANTPNGSYFVGYKICENLNPSNCDEANATVKVVPAVLLANEINGTINGKDGGEAITNVTSNDTIDGASFTLGNEVNLTDVTGLDNRLDLNLTNGKLTVEPETAEGNYTATYKICENLNPTNCQTGTLRAIVTAAPIVANDDDLSNVTINGRDGGVLGIVTGNDTLNGVDVNLSEITISTSSSIATVDANGTMNIKPMTPMGTHKIEYKICENLNSDNCDEANVTAKIDAAPLVANDDDFSSTVIDGRVGGESGVVTLNDKLNDENLSASDVNITLTQDTDIPKTPTVEANGSLVISAGTKAGSYHVGYQICEKLNPTGNCKSAKATVTVKATDIATVDDSGTANGRSGGEAIANIVANDTLTGSTGLVVGDDVNISVVSKDAELDINISNGKVSVKESTEKGVYKAVYKICENLNLDNCADGNITVNVTEAHIVANDIESNTTIDGYKDGTAISNVTVNDTIDGASFTLGTTDRDVSIKDVNYSGNVVDNQIVLDKSTGKATVAKGTPEGNYSIRYQICENLNADNCDEANATIEVSAAIVKAVDDNWTSFPISGITGGDIGHSITLIMNDTIDGNITTGADVNATYNGDTNLTVTPKISQNGSAEGTLNIPANTPRGVYYVGYKICEKINPTNCSEANATIKVTQPIANDDTVSTAKDTNVSVTLLNNDYDPSGGKLKIASVSSPTQGGDLNWTSDGKVIFTPKEGFVGDDTFTYTIGSPNDAKSTGKVTVTVVDLNDSSTNSVTAVSDSTVTETDTNVTISVLVNDYDLEGDRFHISDVNATSQEGGSIVISDDKLIYAPATGFEGTDIFLYTITDANGSTDTALVKVTVADADKLPPNAVADRVYVLAGMSATLNVLDNDSGNNMKLYSITTPSDPFAYPAHGKLTSKENGEITYTPDVNFSSVDSFMYTMRDDKGAIATSTVTIVVTPAPDVTISDANATEGNNLLFDVNLSSEYGADINMTLKVTPGTATAIEDYNATTISVSIPKGTLNAQAALMAILDHKYEKDENLSVSIETINSGTVKDASDTAIGTIVNADPMPSLYIGGGSAKEGEPVVVDVNLSIPTYQDINVTLTTSDGTATLANSDYNSTVATAVILAGKMGATVSIPTIDDGIVEPDETITITPTVNSGDVNSTTAGVATILNNDTPPVLSDDKVDGVWGKDTSIDVMSNDTAGTSPINRGSLSLIDPTTGKAVTSVNVAGEGSWTIDTSGIIVFVPVKGYVGDPKPIRYTMSDTLGNVSDGATIEINYPPVAVNDKVLGAIGKDVNIKVLDNDKNTSKAFDVRSIRITNKNGEFMSDGKQKEVAGEGSWSVKDDGTITFSPDSGFEDPTTPIYYTVSEVSSDGAIDRSNAAKVSIYYKMTLDDVYNTTGITGTAVSVDVLDNDGGCVDASTVQLVNLDTNLSVGLGNDLVVGKEGTWSVESNGSIKFVPISSEFLLDPSPIGYTVKCLDGRISNITKVKIHYPLFARDDVEKNIAKGMTSILDGVLNDNGDIDPTSVKLILPEGFLETHPSAVLTNDKKWLTVPGEGKWKVLSNGTVQFIPVSEPECSPAPVHYNMKSNDGKLSNDAILLPVYNISCHEDKPSSSGGDSMSPAGMLLMMLITGLIGLYFVRREEDRARA